MGYGRFGKVLAQAWSETTGAELVSVCAGDRLSLEEAKSLPGVQVFKNYHEFLSKGKLDVVDIASPNYLHAKQANEAIAAGKHLQLEKPIATNFADARRLLHQKKGSSIIQVGFQYRFAPFWKQFKETIDSGLIGSPSFARIEEWRGPFRKGVGGWRYDGAKVGHQLLEGAVHYFDLAAWLFGMPDTVAGISDSVASWKQGKFGSAFSTLDYERGLKVVVGHTINGVSDQTIVSVSGDGAMIGMILPQVSVAGPNGRVHDIVRAGSWVNVRENGGASWSRKVKDYGEVGEVRLGLQEFVVALRSGREPRVTLRDGFNALVLCLATIKAIETGEVVSLGDFQRAG